MSPRTIVVPLDGSEYAERAIPIAEKLAERMGGGLLLMTAEYSGPQEPLHYLESQAAIHRGCPLEVRVVHDAHAAEAVLDAVNGADDRVVCMTTHGRGRLRWAALGSVAEDVIRNSRRPTVLVGRQCEDSFLDGASHLMACADGGPGGATLAPVAREWATALGLTVRVAVVVHPLDVESAEHPRALMDTVVDQFNGAGATMLRSMYPAGALADFAADLPAGLVGMNSNTRGGLARFALGSVTMGVVSLVKCPVLVTHQADSAPPGDGGPA